VERVGEKSWDQQKKERGIRGKKPGKPKKKGSRKKSRAPALSSERERE
jgi:hypothetical protein